MPVLIRRNSTSECVLSSAFSKEEELELLLQVDHLFDFCGKLLHILYNGCVGEGKVEQDGLA